MNDRDIAGRWSAPTSIRLTKGEIARLDAHAKQRGLSRSQLLRRIVRDFLAEHQDAKPAQQPALFGER